MESILETLEHVNIVPYVSDLSLVGCKVAWLEQVFAWIIFKMLE